MDRRVNYQAVLSDLRRRRDELDAAITAIEMLLAVMPTLAPQTQEGRDE